MRGAARGLIVALSAVVVLFAAPAGAQSPGFVRAVRDLDGGQFLEDEPIWICDPAAPAPGVPWDGVMSPARIRGVDEHGQPVESQSLACSYREPIPRAGDIVHSVWFDARREQHPLDVGVWGGGGLRAGSYEFLSGNGRSLARFRVIAPRASEAAVRAALARAARLSQDGDEAMKTEAARLYEAVFARYPRTSYLTSIYAGLWRLRAHTNAYATDPGLWLDAVFAHFHDTCFGIWALDRFMTDMPAEVARPRLRKLVGLYPDTQLSRAAAAYL